MQQKKNKKHFTVINHTTFIFPITLVVKNYPKYSKGIQKMANIQETMQQQIKKYHDDIDDDDEIHNNPNLHSEEQDELELPDNVSKPIHSLFKCWGFVKLLKRNKMF
ncbi:hypothetical protein RhiirC2_863534 [Rhizophagus irregularis]|uniref:Uncharacterized protein n=1 Tax=Rhizophagus irregularis TaxID=588596 RepID=A0A2N1NM54_9GLOM|nr:hypothetical protein RhiirC2_863534 [Rhizophagus irregularis]